MHDTAFHIGTLAMQTYSDLESASILEIGSRNVNGSIRASALPMTKYVGIDVEDGEGVDFVVRNGEEWPVDDGCFDLVMATSVFEHDSAFWTTFLRMCRKAKSGGHIYISAPSNGEVHRYPRDFWRFYPDAGLALEDLARAEGLEIKLVESFVAEREADEWNDFCAIFRRGPSAAPLPTNFIWNQVRCTNVLTWQSADVLNARACTEDQVLLRREAENAEVLLRKIETNQSIWEAEREALARKAAEARIAEEKSELLLAEARAELERGQEIEMTLAQLDGELKDREHRIAELESNLRQRQEESSQAWASVDAERTAKEEFAASVELHRAEIKQLESKLREADEWVFKLAGERLAAEQLCSRFGSELEKERELRASEQSKLRGLTEQLEQLVAARKLDEARLEKNQRRVEQLLEQLREGEAKLVAKRVEIDSVGSRLANAENELERFKGRLAEKDTSLNERYREIATLTRLLKEQEERGERADEQVAWLLALNDRLRKQSRWWSLLPKSWARRRKLKELREAGVFNGPAYLERYRDVAHARLDPLDHYLRHGMHEGRSRAI